jgi:hypothetical protein
MAKIKRLFPFVMLTAIIFIFCGFSCAIALDSLQLSGFIKHVDKVKKTVLIDVRSSGCEGQTSFLIHDTKILAGMESHIGKWTTFFINSDACQSGRVYTINRAKFDKKRSISR